MVAAQDTTDAPDWRAAGQRIQTLIDASAAGGAVARERAEELVRTVADLYGAGLERVLDVLYALGRLDDDAVAALAADDLVSSLLIVHGLHPYDVATRVENALETVRPYLGTHSGDVELLDVSDDGVVRLRLLGSCDGCPSSSVTLSLAVEAAIMEAAPEVTAIEVETPPEPEPAPRASARVIPVEALRSRLSVADEDVSAGWQEAMPAADLAPGQLRVLDLKGLPVLVCRLGGDLYGFHAECPRCSSSLEQASLERRLGYPAAELVLRCPACRGHYDVRRAGASLDEPEHHLTPLPVLVRDGVVTVAVPVSTSR